jgi:hypothetical protein
MSLRDYFAAAAMSGMCANPEWYERDWATIAKHATLVADEMLKARDE